MATLERTNEGQTCCLLTSRLLLTLKLPSILTTIGFGFAWLG